jgi:hypothetical protein
MRARRISPSDLGLLPTNELAGAVLLGGIRLPDRSLAKGTRLDPADARDLVRAAADGLLGEPVRLAWAEPGDLHENEAAERLALAVGGAGVELRAPRQSRLDLLAKWPGVLHVRAPALGRVNTIDPLEVFTLYHGQAVTAGRVVASVKVAPHLVPGEAVQRGVRIAREEGPLVEVRPYLPLEVGAVAAEALGPDELARFEAGARVKVEALGSRFGGTTVVGDPDPDAAERGARRALEELVLSRGLRVVLVGGVSAGDPLAPFIAALEGLGGQVLRRGVPAHPGSMIWLARLGDSRLLGLPSCGMFALATAADLVLPRLLTGEPLEAADLADLGHGGILTREMRFRFPAYARELDAPEG